MTNFQQDDMRKLLEGHPLSWDRLLEVLPDGIAFVDPHGVIHYVSECFALLTGYDSSELVGQIIEVLLPPKSRDAHRAQRDHFNRDPGFRTMGRDLNITLLRRDGGELAVDIALAPLTLDGEQWVLMLIRDDSVHRSASQAHLEAEERFRIAFEENMAAMVFTDLEGVGIAVNDAFCEMLGRPKEELLGTDLALLSHPEDVSISEAARSHLLSGEVNRVRYVKRYVQGDGRVIQVEVSESPARDEAGRVLYFVSSERDITAQNVLTAELLHQTLHDPLTGLANRSLFGDRLAQAQARVVRSGGLGVVLMLDLDDFKGVNDTFGHLVGDQLLVAVARRFERVTRSSDTLCRFGGDEFLYLTEGLATVAEAEQVAARLLDVLSEPFEITGSLIEQRASAGVVIWDNESTDHAELVQNADAAMHEAKRRSKGHCVVFTPSMRQQAVSRFALTQELRHALQAGEISMHYQPIVDLSTTEVVGFEALMRWQHPQRGWVPPGVFIPLAEQSDLITELGAFALRQAVAAASSWEHAGTQSSRPYVTVNLSARQFHDPNLVSIIEEALSTNELDPGRLILEITESVTLLDVGETLSVMDRLNRHGIDIALDDFGTGFSSLSYLTLLRPKILKIDQSFVSTSLESDRNNTLLETIISLGQKLNMVVLAEGVETQQQLRRLRRLGCELGQGFLFSPAVPAHEVESMIDRVLDEPEDAPTGVPVL